MQKKKHMFRVSDQVRDKPGCTATVHGIRGLKYWMQEVEGLCYIYRCSKNKGAMVTLQLICAIVFAYAYAKIRFSHDMSQLLTILKKDLNTTASAIIIQLQYELSYSQTGCITAATVSV